MALARKFRIFIPTRDSARWVGVFLRAYRVLGVEPLYIVDARTQDETCEILKTQCADFRLFRPEDDYVESGMLEAGTRAVDAAWALRMDDDEFPSQALLRWIAREGSNSIRPGWIISRRDLFFRDGEVLYGRRPSAYGDPRRPDYLSGQVRLYRTDGVKFSNQVHSSGLDVDFRYFGYAPEDCFFVHCVDLLLSPQARLEKIRRYESIRENSTWGVADEYLPELFSDAHLRPLREGLEEFGPLLTQLPRSPADPALLNADELEKIRDLETLGRAQRVDQIFDATAEARIEWIKYVPKSARRPLSGALSSLARAIPSERLRHAADNLWNFG